MAQILPSTEQFPVDLQSTRIDTNEDSNLELIYSGPKANVDAFELSFGQITPIRFAELPNREYQLVSKTNTSHNGRSSLALTYRLKRDVGEEGVQELFGVDLIRDIYSAPFFAGLTNAEILEVRAAFEAREEFDGTTLQNKLYGHLAHGQEQYVDTHYELRLTYNTTSDRELKIASANPNTVQPLPSLNQSLRNLVDQLPSGEWMKKPVQVRSAGKQGWSVVETYQWAVQWSEIYGGTFTGLDAT